MRWFVREYTSFSSRERRSLLYILILLILSVFYRIYLSSHQPETLELTEDQIHEINDFIASFQTREKESPPAKRESRIHADKKTTEFNLEMFDPNNVELNKLLEMGFSEFVAGNIIRYREAGGIFREAADLSRIYGLDEAKFMIIKPFIYFPEKASEDIQLIEEKESAKGLSEEMILKGINSAGFRDLMKIENMDAEIAGRILKYRDLLGGYYSFTQLGEVYGMNDSLRMRIADNFYIDSINIRRLSLKEVGFGKLLRHPYMKEKDVREFFRLKEYYADSLCVEHIYSNRIFPDSVMRKISPYFRVR